MQIHKITYTAALIALLLALGCASSPKKIINEQHEGGPAAETGDVVLATIRLKASRPSFIAAHPDGSRVYVVDAYAPPTVSVIDAQSLTHESTIVLQEGGAVNGIAVSPDGARLYAAVSQTERGSPRSGTLFVLDAQSYSIREKIRVGKGPADIAASPDGQLLYVINKFSRTLSVIDTGSCAVIDTVDMGTEALHVSVSPDSSRVYASNVINKSVTVVEAENSNLRREITIGTNSWDIAHDPDNNTIYVTQYHGDAVSVIDADTNIIIKEIYVGSAPAAVVVHPDKKRAYVTTVEGPVLSVIDTQKREVISEYDLPVSGAYYMTISPDGRRLYICTDYYHVIVLDTLKLEPDEPAPEKEPEVIERIIISGIWFDFDYAVIKDEYKPVFDSVVALIRNYPGRDILIEGHACAIGTDSYNMGLSLRRAAAAKQYLVGKGVSPERLHMRWYGERQPLADNTTEANRKLNRRVEFKIIDTGGKKQQ